MSNNDVVDTKIIEAKFDAKDFEKGVNKTIKKLDELKKSLNMKDSSKSITDFAKETTDATEKTASAMEKLSNRMTTFVGQIKQQLVTGLASEVTGAFFQMQQSINGFFKSITTGSINTGMSRYTEILNSVRTMTAAGKDQEQAYQQIKRLAEYSDQTSYSLSTMAGSMSKMVAAGAGLEDARKSVEGLANMAAAAGVNIYDATRAFTNFTQAYSSGSMRLQDWMSFESLNMSTENTMKIFQQAAVQAGTLKKEMKATIKDGKKIQQEVFKTTNKTNKKVTAGKQVAIKGFRDSLRYGWLDQETMRIATGVLSYVDDLGISVDKLSKEQLEEFANKAYLAAKEARSFSDVMGTVRDVLATGWSNTFENIFGKLDKATEFFTQLADSNLLSILYDLSEYRNEIFEEWNRITVDGKNGSDLFKEALLNIDEAIGAVTEKFKLLVPSASSVGDWLFLQTKAFNEATSKMTEWLNSSDSGFSRATKIAKALQSIGIVLHFVGRVVGTVWNGVSTVWKAASPIFDAVLKALMNFSTHLYRLDRDTTIFNDLSNAFNNVAIAAKPIVDVVTPVIGILEKIAEFFVDTALSTATMNVQLIADALGFIIEIFGGKSAQQLKSAEGGVLNRIKQSIVDLKTAIYSCLGATKEFFGGLLDDLKKLLGIGDQVAGEEGGFFQNVQKFFETNQFVQDTKAWINQAITDIGNFVISIPERIKQFGINIGDYIYGLFWSKETVTDVDEKGNKITGTIEVTTPFKKWLDTILENIRTFIVSIPEKVKKLANDIGTFAGTVLNSITDFLFGEEETTTIKWGHNDGNQWVVDRIETVTARFFTGSGLYKVIESVKAFIKSIPKRVSDGLGTVGSIISAFWEGLFWKEEKVADVDEKGKKVFKKITVKTALHRWLERAIKDVKEFIKSIPSKISAGIKGVGSLLKTFVGALFGKENGEEMTSQELMDALKKPFEGLSLSSVIGTIKNIGVEFMNAIVSIFTGTDDLETNKQKLSETVAGAITWVKEKAESAWKTVSDFFVNLPHMIASFFNPEKTGEEINRETADPSPIQKAISDFGNTVGGFIAGIPDNLLTFVDNTVYELGCLWARIYHAITGQGEYKENYDPRLGKDPQNKKLINTINEMAPDVSEVRVSQWDLFATHLGQTISNIFAKIPTFIAQGIDLAIRGIDAAINWFGEFFKDEKVADKIAEGADVSGEIEKGLEESADETAKEQSPLAIAIGNIASSISKLITQTIPKTLSNAWDWLRTNATEWKGKVAGVLDANGITWANVQEKVEAIGAKISEYIAKLPEYIKIGADFFDRLWNGVWTEEVDDGDPLGISKVAIKTKGIKYWVIQFGDTIVDAFVAAGPAILDGINSALKWVGEKINLVTTFFQNRDRSKSLSKEMQEEIDKGGDNAALLKSLQTLGETIKTTITQTIPEFISAAFDEVKAAIPGILNTFFGGMFGSNEEVKENVENAVSGLFSEGTVLEGTGDTTKISPKQGSIGFLGVLKNFFVSDAMADEADNSKKNADAVNDGLSGLALIIERVKGMKDGIDVGLLATLGIVAIILTKVVDMFSIADEIESVGYSVKAAGIGIALAGVAAILGEIGALAATAEDVFDENGKKIGVKNDKLDYLMEQLTSIGTWIKDIIGQIVTIVGIWKGGEAASDFLSLLDDLMLLKKGGEEAAKGFAKKGLEIFGGVGIGVSIGSMLQSMIQSLISGVGPALNDVGTEILNFGEVIIPALDKIVEAQNRITKVVAFPHLLREFVEGFWGIGPNIVEGDTEEYAEYLLGISTFLETLGTGLSNFEKIKDPTKTLNDMTAFVKNEAFFGEDGFLGAMHDAVINWGVLTWGRDAILDLSAQFNLLGDAMKVFGTGITELNPDSVEALDKTLDTLNKLAESFSPSQEKFNAFDEIKNGSLVTFGREIQQFANSMKFFVQNLNAMELDVLDETAYGIILKKIDLTVLVIKKFFESFGEFEEFKGIDGINVLIEYLEPLTEQVSTFINNLNKDLSQEIDLNRISILEQATLAFTNLASAASSLSGVVDLQGATKKMHEFIHNMLGLGSPIKGFEDDYGKTIAELIYQIFEDEGALKIQPEIIPVLKMTEFDAAFEKRFGPNWMFNAEAMAEQAMAANPENVTENQNGNETTDLSGIVTQLTSVISYLTNLDTNVSKIGTVQVDSEATIGYFGPLLDQYLNDQALKAER